jgi:hypothetical protein
MKQCGTICSWENNQETDVTELKICQIKGCEKTAIYLGMCSKHYWRMRTYGSPCVTKYHVLRGLPADQRFARQHKKMENGCWEWTGPVDQDGYGIFTAVVNDVKYARAHRFSWAFHTLSPIPKGMMVCHSCDNPRCVSPAHLWLGSCLDNHADMDSKGRRFNARGEDHGSSLLTEGQVREILADSRPYAEIAHAYSVKMTTISSIKNRVSWAHIKVDHAPRAKRGSGAGNRGNSTRITPDAVREIRTSEAMGKDLAVKFGVSAQLITNIKKRRCWAHVE